MNNIKEEFDRCARLHFDIEAVGRVVGIVCNKTLSKEDDGHTYLRYVNAKGKYVGRRLRDPEMAKILFGASDTVEGYLSVIRPLLEGSKHHFYPSDVLYVSEPLMLPLIDMIMEILQLPHQTMALVAIRELFDGPSLYRIVRHLLFRGVDDPKELQNVAESTGNHQTALIIADSILFATKGADK